LIRLDLDLDLTELVKLLKTWFHWSDFVFFKGKLNPGLTLYPEFSELNCYTKLGFTTIIISWDWFHCLFIKLLGIGSILFYFNYFPLSLAGESNKYILKNQFGRQIPKYYL
jgi:hypothetical protein